MRFVPLIVFERWQKKLSNMRHTAVPHISQLPRIVFILVGICVMRVTSFKSTKSSQILTLAQSIGPFSADVNLKYERCNFNSYFEKWKRSAPVEVELSRTSTGAIPSWHISWLGVVILPYSGVSRTHQKCPRSNRVSAPFLSILAVSFISPFRGI